MASLQGYVTRLAYDAVKTQHSVAVRALLFNLFFSLATLTAKAT
jgi:hypothetical protein